ncbi:DUF6934 family protein [Dyadobacter sp. CY323]|uniref:DUF6934 family protein n=1 Tax=Dyadobacter sp. CY323 TaxID=2907302 RepID=UPI0038D514C8
MNEKFYPFEVDPSDFRYEFLSVSEMKTVKKVVLITETERRNVHNVALLDVLDDGSLCDLTESRNNDLRMVMATVMQIVADFLRNNPESYVIFRGSDPRRHRLYSIIISRELKELTNTFEIFGLVSSFPITFVPDTTYNFYLVKKKS